MNREEAIEVLMKNVKVMNPEATEEQFKEYRDKLETYPTKKLVNMVAINCM